MKKHVKFLVTLLLLCAMVLAPASAFAASDRCSSCNSDTYSVNCNGNLNANCNSTDRVNGNVNASTNCNINDTNCAANYNCDRNGNCTVNNSNCTVNNGSSGNASNGNCTANNSSDRKANYNVGNRTNCNTSNSSNCQLNSLSNDTESNSVITSLRNYLWQYLQGCTNRGCTALNGDNAIPVFKMNTTDDAGYVLEDTYALQVIALVNQERVAAGLEELVIDQGLCEAATTRVAEIQTLFSHTRPDGSSCFTALADFNVQYSTAGENIAIGQASPEAVVQAWMESPGHKANIMNPSFTRIGVASLANNGGTYGGYAWAQFFAN